MLRIDSKNSKFTVELDTNHPKYSQVVVIIRSLLSARSAGENMYYLNFDDLCVLKTKLDNLGLMEGRKISENARNTFANISALHKRNEDIKSGIHNEHVKKLLVGKLKTVPYEDQITGVSFLINNPRVGLFDSQGIGKSLEALSAIVALPTEIRKTLIICPLSVAIGFEKEVQKHTHLKSCVIPSGKAAALELLQKNVATNWDILVTHPENLVQSGNQKDIYSDITKLLKTIRFDLIIVDEFHQYKNIDAKRTKCVISLVEEIRNKDKQKPRVILMTGTPVSESPLNAYAVLKLIGNDFQTNMARFENYFTMKKNASFMKWMKDKNGTPVKREITVSKVVGYKNLSELKQMMERVSIRRTKQDLKGFPDKIFVTRDVVLSGKQLKLYKAACSEVVQELEKSSQVNLETFFNGNAKTVKLRQLMNHPMFIEEDCPSAKYDELDNILEEVLSDPTQKVVVWTEFRKAVDLIYDRWNEQYGVVKLYGGVDITDQLIHNFENEVAPRIAACIPAKAGTGVNLLARARTAIYLDRPYSYTLFMQSIDRIHRRIKTEGVLSELDKIKAQPATIIFLDIVNSLDEVIREKLNSKQELAEAIMESNAKLISMGRADLLKYLR